MFCLSIEKSAILNKGFPKMIWDNIGTGTENIVANIMQHKIKKYK